MEQMIRRKTINPGKRNAQIKEVLFLTSLLIYPVLNFIVFYVILNANSVVLSFQNIDAKTFETSWVGFTNYIEVIKSFSASSGNYMLGLKNSLLAYAVSLFIRFPLGLLLAFYVYKKSLGTGAFRFIVMIPTILSGMIVGLMFKQFAYNLPLIMKSYGFENFPALMKDPDWTFFTTLYYEFWCGFGMSTIYYSNTMNNISEEIVESAQLEGATYVQEMIYIAIPMSWSTISTFLITNFSAILSDSGPLYLFWQYSAPRESYRLGYIMFQTTMKTGQSAYPIMATLGVLCTLIMFPLTMLVRKGLDKLNPMED